MFARMVVWPRSSSTLLLYLLSHSDIQTVVRAGFLGIAKLYNETDEAVAERVYRLHYNEGQNRTDVFCQVLPRLCFSEWTSLLSACPIKIVVT
jgi:hypothetical protein